MIERPSEALQNGVEAPSRDVPVEDVPAVVAPPRPIPTEDVQTDTADLLPDPASSIPGQSGDSRRGESPEGDGKCVICHCNYRETKTLPRCKHTFHTECLDGWLKRSKICPECRIPLGLCYFFYIIPE